MTSTLRDAHLYVQSIPALLDHLRATPPPTNGVLSAYLPVRPVQVAGQAYLVRFREACKGIRAALADAGREERRAFETAAARVESFLTDEFVPRHPGVAVFAADEPGYLHVAPLPQRPAFGVVWDRGPLLAPLEEVLDEYERVAVVLTDRRTARVFSIYLGEIESTRVVESDDPGRRTVDGVAGNYARHYQNHTLQHVRRTARAAVEVLRAYPFDRLLIGGPEEVRTILWEELPRPLRARYAGMLPISVTASDAEVLEATLDAAKEIERGTEVEMVDALVAAARTPRVALGLRPVLDAVSTGRTHHLFIADSFAGTGGECPSCGRLVAGLDRCPDCGGRPEPLTDLRERLVDRALEQGARIETVSGDAAALLMAHGGVGAWTRY